jgi:hypothetical protein
VFFFFFFLPVNSWVTPQLQLWLASSSPDKMGQFSFSHCKKSTQWSATPLLWDIDLSHSSLSVLVPHLTPTCRVHLLATTPFSEVHSVFHQPLLSVSRLQFTVNVFQFCSGRMQSVYKPALHYFGRFGGFGGWSSPVGFVDSCRQLWKWASREKWQWLVSGQMLTGTWFSSVGCR